MAAEAKPLYEFTYILDGVPYRGHSAALGRGQRFGLRRVPRIATETVHALPESHHERVPEGASPEGPNGGGPLWIDLRKTGPERGAHVLAKAPPEGHGIEQEEQREHAVCKGASEIHRRYAVWGPRRFRLREYSTSSARRAASAESTRRPSSVRW